MVSLIAVATAVGLGLGGCSTNETAAGDEAAAPVDRQTDNRPVTLADRMPPPIMGGGLHLTADGAWAVVADADRDRIHVVDLQRGVAVHAIELAPGTIPWRLAEDAAGKVHVTARGTGEVIAISPAAGEVVSRTSVCPNPRGIAALDDDTLMVACEGGRVVTLGPALQRARVLPGATDLRDVFVLDGRPRVTRFRSTYVHEVDDPTAYPTRARNVLVDGSTGCDAVSHRLTPTTAWRTRGLDGDSLLMLHQLASLDPVELPRPRDEEDSEGDPTTGGGEPPTEVRAAYGGGGGGGRAPRGPDFSVVQTAISVGDGETYTTAIVDLAVLAVDIDISPARDRIALAVPGRAEFPELGLLLVDWPPAETCIRPEASPPIEGQLVAVEFDDAGRLYAFSREPAALVFYDPDTGEVGRIPLAGTSRRDTGHDLFHLMAGAPIACASCHPEGGDDGHVWTFEPGGRRHTPALAVGLAGTEPFHWTGDLADMHALVADTHTRRMGAPPLSGGRVRALERWVLGLPVPPPVRAVDAVSERGRRSFAALGCASCHGGAALSNATSVDLGFDIPLQVPALHGVAHHSPYMHDGRAETLADAVRDMLDRTRPGAAIDDAEIADLVAYLQTL